MSIDHSKLWAEGKYVDLWTIPHILSGVIMAGSFYWLGFSFWPNIISSIILMIGWEFFELHFLGIHEHLSNKVMDVVTGIIGFFAMYGFIIKYSINKLTTPLSIIIIIFIFLNFWGYLAYEKRSGKIS